MKELKEALEKLPRKVLVEMVLNLAHAVNFAERDLVEIAKELRRK